MGGGMQQCRGKRRRMMKGSVQWQGDGQKKVGNDEEKPKKKMEEDKK